MTFDAVAMDGLSVALPLVLKEAHNDAEDESDGLALVVTDADARLVTLTDAVLLVLTEGDFD